MDLSPSYETAGAGLAPLIEHTLLRADATDEELRALCAEARQLGVAAVCVNSGRVALARAELAGSTIKVCSVVGFPLGAMATAAKAFEAAEAVRAGADEIDMVIDLGGLKGRQLERVERDIRAVVEAAQPAPVKVILETAALDEGEKRLAVELVRRAGARYLKTSTGFGPGGATCADVALLRQLGGPDLLVKAAGGVRTRADAERLRAAGADRIGTSAARAILADAPATGGAK